MKTVEEIQKEIRSGQRFIDPTLIPQTNEECAAYILGFEDRMYIHDETRRRIAQKLLEYDRLMILMNALEQKQKEGK